MTTCNKAQANTSRPEEASLRLPDPGHNLLRDKSHLTVRKGDLWPLALSFFGTYPSFLLTYRSFVVTSREHPLDVTRVFILREDLDQPLSIHHNISQVKLRKIQNFLSTSTSEVYIDLSLTHCLIFKPSRSSTKFGHSPYFITTKATYRHIY